MCSFSLRFVLTWHHSVSPAHASPLNEDEDDIDHVAASRMHQLLALCRTVHDHTKGVPHMSSLSTICRVCEHVQLSDVQQLPFSDEDTATWVCMQSLSGVMQSHSVFSDAPCTVPPHCTPAWLQHRCISAAAWRHHPAAQSPRHVCGQVCPAAWRV